MDYVSTRGAAPILTFDEVLLAGLARDGGLYVPARWPSLSADALRALRGRSYPDTVVAVIRPFVGDAFSDETLLALARDAYGAFDHPAVAPLKQLDQQTWLLELFHGPTLAFKDFALQMVGRFFDQLLGARGQRITIVGATSGDTGSAAIEACRDRDQIEIFILHPKDRVSEVQRRQMTTVPADNVHNIAIEGTFDDCQDLVKAMFNDQPFRDEMRLSAVNSINWARILVQVAYYVHAALALGAPDRKVSFAVPTGNFGNVYAGYVARRMGLPLGRLIVGSNANDILTRFFDSGAMSLAPVRPTLSPSMDIQVSSNFERFLFELLARDGAKVTETLAGLRQTGRFDIDPGCLEQARAVFDAARLDDDETMAEMARLYRETGELIDPHSAIGIAAARAKAPDDGTPVVALATAHPAKFPDAVERACGRRPALPARLADLYERAERMTVLPNDLNAVEASIRDTRNMKGAA